MPQQKDPTRSPATQPYRTTRAAQLAARHAEARQQPPPYHVRKALRDRTLAVGRADETIQPHPPTTQIRVYQADGRTATLRSLAEVLSPKTRATLAAIDSNRGRR